MKWESGLRLLPDHMIEGVRAYIMYGRATGGFLTAVFENNLVDALRRSDFSNRSTIMNWAEFLSFYAPPDSWGSKERVETWMKHGGLERKAVKEEKDASSGNVRP